MAVLTPGYNQLPAIRTGGAANAMNAFTSGMKEGQQIVSGFVNQEIAIKNQIEKERALRRQEAEAAAGLAAPGKEWQQWAPGTAELSVGGIGAGLRGGQTPKSGGIGAGLRGRGQYLQTRASTVELADRLYREKQAELQAQIDAKQAELEGLPPEVKAALAQAVSSTPSIDISGGRMVPKEPGATFVEEAGVGRLGSQPGKVRPDPSAPHIKEVAAPVTEEELAGLDPRKLNEALAALGVTQESVFGRTLPEPPVEAVVPTPEGGGEGEYYGAGGKLAKEYGWTPGQKVVLTDEEIADDSDVGEEKAKRAERWNRRLRIDKAGEVPELTKAASMAVAKDEQRMAWRQVQGLPGQKGASLGTYIVQSGESLTKISRKTGIPLEDLINANRDLFYPPEASEGRKAGDPRILPGLKGQRRKLLTGVDALLIGERLKLPGAADSNPQASAAVEDLLDKAPPGRRAELEAELADLRGRLGGPRPLRENPWFQRFPESANGLPAPKAVAAAIQMARRTGDYTDIVELAGGPVKKSDLDGLWADYSDYITDIETFARSYTISEREKQILKEDVKDSEAKASRVNMYVSANSANLKRAYPNLSDEEIEDSLMPIAELWADGGTGSTAAAAKALAGLQAGGEAKVRYAARERRSRSRESREGINARYGRTFSTGDARTIRVVDTKWKLYMSADAARIKQRNDKKAEVSEAMKGDALLAQKLAPTPQEIDKEVNRQLAGDEEYRLAVRKSNVAKQDWSVAKNNWDRHPNNPAWQKPPGTEAPGKGKEGAAGVDPEQGSEHHDTAVKQLKKALRANKKMTRDSAKADLESFDHPKSGKLGSKVIEGILDEVFKPAKPGAVEGGEGVVSGKSLTERVAPSKLATAREGVKGELRRGEERTAELGGAKLRFEANQLVSRLSKVPPFEHGRWPTRKEVNYGKEAKEMLRRLGKPEKAKRGGFLSDPTSGLGVRERLSRPASDASKKRGQDLSRYRAKISPENRAILEEWAKMANRYTRDD